jgi:hypothetical protein
MQHKNKASNKTASSSDQSYIDISYVQWTHFLSSRVYEQLRETETEMVVAN